jgi:hypothetical protein
MELKTLVFESGGVHNTDATLQIAAERAQALAIGQAVVASSGWPEYFADGPNADFCAPAI